MTNNNETIKERIKQDQEAILAELRKIPIISLACERAHVSRASYYRWRTEDEKFRVAADEALATGETFVTDMAESQLISLLKDKNFPAISLWLKIHHPKYANRVEVTAHINNQEITPEQKTLMKEALNLADLLEPNAEDKKHD